MDNKKFEQLIDLIINEDEEQARALFHDIVVEKSREIYESMMDEEMEMEGMGGQVGDLLDEINAEEEGMTEEEDEADIEFDDEAEDDGEDVTHDLEADHDDEGDLEDRVVDLEDKLDQLMAEFESIMGGEGEEDMGDMDAGDEEDMGDDEMAMMEESDDEEEAVEESVMEAVELQKVAGLYGSKIGGDNGAQPKSPSLQNSDQAGMDSKPVKFSGQAETVPTGPKGPSNIYSKGETSVKNANNFKNSPGQKKADLTSAPKPKHGDDGSNAKSIVAK